MDTKRLSLLHTAIVVVIGGLCSSCIAARAHEELARAASTSVTRSATVARIDRKGRWVTLELADGSFTEVKAAPAVRNFDRIQVGDEVVASRSVTVNIEILPPGLAAPEGAGGATVASAPKGSMPKAAVVDAIVVSGTVTDIDRDRRLITIVGTDGTSRTVEVGADVQKFDEIETGDVVVVTVTTATSLEVKSRGR